MTFGDFDLLGLVPHAELPAALRLALAQTSLLPVELVGWVATAESGDLLARLQQAVTTRFESGNEQEIEQASQLAQLIVRRLGQLGTPVGPRPQPLKFALASTTSRQPPLGIRLSPSILRQPQLFDGLSTSSGLCRDLVIWAAMCNKPVVRLYLPDFCRTFGYERSNLLRLCTPEELQEISQIGWPQERTRKLTNVLALALVRLITHVKIEGTKVVETLDEFEVNKGTGTRAVFTLSQKILEENRKATQVIILSEYLSLYTSGGKKRPKGYPDQAARKLFLRLSLKRQQLNDPINGVYPSQDDYQELTEVAGFSNRPYAHARSVAYYLRRLLERVGKMPSIRLQPSVVLNKSLNVYQVDWIQLEPDALVTGT